MIPARPLAPRGPNYGYEMNRTDHVPEVVSVSDQRLFRKLQTDSKIVSFDGDDLGSDAIKVASTLRGKPSAAVGVLLHHLELLQGLEGLASDRTGAGNPVAGEGAVVGAA